MAQARSRGTLRHGRWVCLCVFGTGYAFSSLDRTAALLLIAANYETQQTRLEQGRRRPNRAALDALPQSRQSVRTGAHLLR
jgi:hypothetical protein